MPITIRKHTPWLKSAAVLAAIVLSGVIATSAASASPLTRTYTAAAANTAYHSPNSSTPAASQAATPRPAASGTRTPATAHPAVSTSLAKPGPTPFTAGYFRITNKSSNKCLTPWGTGDGTAITQVACNASDNRQWWLLDTGSVGTISNYGTGKCLDLWGNVNADAQLVFTWTCYGANSQQWRPVNKGGQYFELHPYYTDKCLDLASSSPNSGAVIQQWGCHPFNDNQIWILG